MNGVNVCNFVVSLGEVSYGDAELSDRSLENDERRRWREHGLVPTRTRRGISQSAMRVCISCSSCWRPDDGSASVCNQEVFDVGASTQGSAP